MYPFVLIEIKFKKDNEARIDGSKFDITRLKFVAL